MANGHVTPVLGVIWNPYLIYDFFAFYILWLIFYIRNTNGIYLKRILAFISLGILSVAGLLVLSVIRLCIRRLSLSSNSEVILYSFIASLVVCGIIFGLMEDMNEPRFWLPLLPFGIMIFEIEGKNEEWRFPILKNLVGVIVSVMIMITSVGAIHGEITNPHEGKMKNLEISQYLADNGYTQGYLQYWLANTITEQTSGRVVARPIMYDDTFEMMPWSNRIDYVSTYPLGEVFVVIDKKSYVGDIYSNYVYKYAGAEIVRDDEDWLLMVVEESSCLEDSYLTALNNGEVISQADRFNH